MIVELNHFQNKYQNKVSNSKHTATHTFQAGRWNLNQHLFLPFPFFGEEVLPAVITQVTIRWISTIWSEMCVTEFGSLSTSYKQMHRNKGKVKLALQQAIKAHRRSRGGGGWLTPRPGRFTPGKESRYPLSRRLSGPQDRSGRTWKISPPPESDLQTVQPVASGYKQRNNSRDIYASVGIAVCITSSRQQHDLIDKHIILSDN